MATSITEKRKVATGRTEVFMATPEISETAPSTALVGPPSRRLELGSGVAISAEKSYGLGRPRGEAQTSNLCRTRCRKRGISPTGSTATTFRGVGTSFPPCRTGHVITIRPSSFGTPAKPAEITATAAKGSAPRVAGIIIVLELRSS